MRQPTESQQKASAKRRLEALAAACPLWALSPYEQGLYQQKNIPMIRAGKHWRAG